MSLGLPYKDEFLRSISDLNEWVGNRALKRYQHLVLSRIPFQVTSPYTGEVVSLRHSLLNNKDLTVAYVFADEHPFLLMTGPIAKGYPLQYLVNLNQSDCHVIDGPPLDQQLTNLSPLPTNLAQFLTQEAQILSHPSCGNAPIAVLGSPNFAHVFWNNFPAVHLLPHLRLDLNSIRFYQKWTPLGALHKRFPFITASQCLTALPSGGLNHIVLSHGFIAPLGATQAPRSLTTMLTQQFLSEANAEIQTLIQQLTRANAYSVWISVKGGNKRQCTNQQEFLCQLVVNLLDRNLAQFVILDGFSVPETAGSHYDASVAEVTEIIRSMEELSPSFRAYLGSGRIIVQNGLLLSDSIALASTASFYITHGGTIQHKIAWMFSVRGVVHVPYPSPALEYWYADQSAVSHRPYSLPASVVRASRSETHTSRNDNYAISNIPGALSFIISRIVKEGWVNPG